MSNDFKYKEMKHKDIKILKEKLWKENGCKCPVLDKEIPLDKMVLDHAHKRNDESYSSTKGVIREVLDFRTNAVLGKLENSIKRTGLSKEPDFDIGQFLRNAAQYFEKGAYKDEQGYYYIHPKEIPKKREVGLREYKKVIKYYFDVYPGRKKLPEKPTYSTPKWEKMLEEVENHINSLQK